MEKKRRKRRSRICELTAEIARTTFGLTPSEHKKLKGLEKENLRDHMTNLELLFTALGEEFTKNFAIKEDAQGFEENQYAATKGGDLAGEMRRNAEKKGMQVVSNANFLDRLKGDNTPPLPPDSTEK
jgi:DNA-damage-inducible protein D